MFTWRSTEDAIHYGQNVAAKSRDVRARLLKTRRRALKHQHNLMENGSEHALHWATGRTQFLREAKEAADLLLQDIEVRR